MRHALTASLLFCVSLAAPAGASVPEQPRTVFQLAETAWAVGTVQLGRPMKFRDGKLLAYPAQIDDLLWAPNHTKPRNMMLIVEITAADGDKPYLGQDDKFFAAIRLLPEHAY